MVFSGDERPSLAEERHGAVASLLNSAAVIDGKKTSLIRTKIYIPIRLKTLLRSILSPGF